jgi:hypothetical protein
LSFVTTELVSEAAALPILDAVQAARVGVEHHDVRVETMPARRIVGAVNAVTVALPHSDAGDVHVPNEGRALRDGDARLFVTLVE